MGLMPATYLRVAVKTLNNPIPFHGPFYPPIATSLYIQLLVGLSRKSVYI